MTTAENNDRFEFTEDQIADFCGMSVEYMNELIEKGGYDFANLISLADFLNTYGPE